MANKTSKSNKSSVIRYRLSFEFSEYSEDITKYLQRQSHCLNGRQKVEQIIETFLLPLVLSPEDPNFKAIVVESLSKLKSQIEIIQVMTGISLYDNYQFVPSQSLSLTAHTSIVEQHQGESQIDNETKDLTVFEELKVTIENFKQQLSEDIDPLVISQALTKIQPEEEESWTGEMWQIYDSFYEEVSQLEYQSTFSPETSA